MEQVAKLDKGFTLIEVLISIVLLLIISLAILASLQFYATRNLHNMLRDEAIKIAQECAEDLRSLVKCTSTTSTTDIITDTITRKIGDSTYEFEITYPNPDSFLEGNNSVIIIVKYKFKGKEYTYTIETSVFKE